ncbi:uncharacterized protein DUF2871 [Propionicimonas paludicola]|uniref:Uncharacterized protein DUF2871 n=1 Tax=Propionicimonas paludicola TaxID=185243 RepID=A0A2A9CPW7_9ACTN|nr:DUF2871 domain-containing protein [Propionicimonas paludicola]PFG16464.1 uncharacterized protein DUF2871 [Propionicimonas paludicola]
MRRLYFAAITYTVLGLVSGVFFREFTRATAFTGATQLGLVHTHLLALGTLMMLIVLALDLTLGLSGSRSFSWFFTTYNAGLVVTAGTLVWHGLLQVAGQDAGPAVAGIAGLGHILLTIGLGCLLFSLNRPVRARLAATETER